MNCSGNRSSVRRVENTVNYSVPTPPQQVTQELSPLEAAAAQTPAKVAGGPESGSAPQHEANGLLGRPVPLMRSTSHPIEGRRWKSGATRKVTLLTRRTTVESSDSSTNGDGDEER